MNEITLAQYDKEFLELSWIWLNDPEIKKLTNTPDITKSDQLLWFNGLPTRCNYRVWGVIYNGDRIGVIGLKNINDISAEYFGYIGEKGLWNRGLSKQILEQAALQARSLNLQFIWLKVKSENARAIKAYIKFGFQIKKIDSEFVFMDFMIE